MIEGVHAVTTLGLDALGRNAACKDPNCYAQLITTTRGDDAIILIGQCYCSGIVSVTDSSGLVFAQRLSSVQAGLWEYYARAVSPLRSDNITVVFATQPNMCLCGFFSGIQALAIHGANTGVVFDQNPSIPATILCPSGQPIFVTCSASIQASTMDFVIASTAINDAGPCQVTQGIGEVSGFTTITTNQGFGASFEVDYAIVNASSNVVFNCNGTDPVAIVMDAVSFHRAFGI